jgi:hypothetical protein
MDLDEKAGGIAEYGQMLDKMLEEDKDRMEHSRQLADDITLVRKTCYTTMKWPVRLLHPMFEARAAYAVPNNYFQNILVDGERIGNSFAHGSMRSVFFVGERLVLFSKSTHFKDAREFFTSFILLHLDKGEYRLVDKLGDIELSARVEKPMKNLVTGEVEKKKILFNFSHKPVNGRIVSRDQAARSARFKNVYKRFGGAQTKSASMDLEGYAITVPHFSPHPYMLQLKSQFGFEENKDFQLAVGDYFRSRISRP